MTDFITTPCIRCGKTRILAKTWKEKLGDGSITYTTTVCPDKECQKIVESDLQKKSDKMAALHEKSLERRLAANENRKAHSTRHLRLGR